jgi:hypothetical protein
LSNNLDRNVETKGPQAADTVVNEEGQYAADSVTEINNRDKVPDLTGVCPGVNLEVLLETWQRGNDG